MRHRGTIRSRAPTAERALDQPPQITWVEPQVYHVYESDGTFLGEARIPPRTSITVFSRDRLWGVRRGDFDEQYVVRLGVRDPRETTKARSTP